MIDGLTLTAVGMLTVFAFLAILVLAMSVLRRLVSKFSSEARVTAEQVAAMVAVVHAARAPSRKEPRQ